MDHSQPITKNNRKLLYNMALYINFNRFLKSAVTTVKVSLIFASKNLRIIYYLKFTLQYGCKNKYQKNIFNLKIKLSVDDFFSKFFLCPSEPNFFLTFGKPNELCVTGGGCPASTHITPDRGGHWFRFKSSTFSHGGHTFFEVFNPYQLFLSLVSIFGVPETVSNYLCM